MRRAHGEPLGGEARLGDRRRVGAERRPEALVVALMTQDQAAHQLVVGMRGRALGAPVEGERQQDDGIGGAAGLRQGLDPRRRYQVEQRRCRDQVVADESPASSCARSKHRVVNV